MVMFAVPWPTYLPVESIRYEVSSATAIHPPAIVRSVMTVTPICSTSDTTVGKTIRFNKS